MCLQCWLYVAISVLARQSVGLQLSKQGDVPAWSDNEEAYYSSLGCKDLFKNIVREESAKRPGLIIAGQGGSATRAFQEMVNRAGTHYFGYLDPETKDSMATRWSKALDYHVDVITDAGKVNYHLSDVEPTIRKNVSKAVCRSLTIIDRMQQLDPNRPWQTRAWAFKEPWLRLLLPFYDDVVGAHGYKFLHVTRDVRNIHDTHGDESMMGNEFLERSMQKVYDLAAYSKRLKLDDAELSAALVGIEDVYIEHGTKLGLSMDQVKVLGQFAYVWAVIELDLKHRWEESRPDHYFRISGRKLETADEAWSTAKQLAKFLGLADPSDDTIRSMAETWNAPDASPDHWYLMNAIVNLDGMQLVRDALRAFDNLSGLRDDIP